MKTIKERLTEGGASGAFFFFTKDERFIAKSCTTDEIAHIRRSAVLMAHYLEENPYSFITKVRTIIIYSCICVVDYSYYSNNNYFLCLYNRYMVLTSFGFTELLFISSSRTTSF